MKKTKLRDIIIAILIALAALFLIYAKFSVLSDSGVPVWYKIWLVR